VTRTAVEIKTEDGVCPASVFRPAAGGAGPWPGVLMFMDGIGMRPAIMEVGEAIAQLGYVVLLPDMFYRAGAYEPVDPKQLFTDPKVRDEWRAKFISSIDQAKAMRDTRAFLDYLASLPDVVKGPVGVTGYCMGGGMALAAAGFFPDRVAAAAAFHPGGLATDAPTSPHLLAPKIKARVYVGGASEDANFPDEQKQRLEQALRDAGVEHTVVTYPAKHGWVPRDTPVHDPAQAQRHLDAVAALFGAALSRS
jgi:carboxymethylenebutenolidase